VKSSTPVLVMTEGKTPRSRSDTPETNVRSRLHRSSGRKPEGMTRKANVWNTGTGGAWQARLVRRCVWMAGLADGVLRRAFPKRLRGVVAATSPDDVGWLDTALHDGEAAATLEETVATILHRSGLAAAHPLSGIVALG
jgi:hypothetical protein